MKVEYSSLFDPGKSIQVWICDGACCNGNEFHREDGPAVIFPDGTKEWWIHGKKLTDEEATILRGNLIAQAMRAPFPTPLVAPSKAEFRKKNG